MGYRLGKRVERSERSIVRDELDRILGSSDFDASRRSREFLRYIVEETLAGRGNELTQSSIATRVFERKDDFDALLDPIVRIQAGRLRRSLERYYLLAGKKDAVSIDVPRGAYVPVFRLDRESAYADVRPLSSASAPRPAAPPAELVEWPSVSVERVATDEGSEGEAAATRVKEELTLELCRYRDVRVILRHDEDRLDPSRSAHARFELRGRVRREGDGWRLIARLVDRTTGEQVWGDEYRASAAADDL